MSSRVNPLELGEIVHITLKELQDDLPTLSACVQVNTLWAEEAVSLLWQNCGRYCSEDCSDCPPYPPVTSLAAMCDMPLRQQWYAEKIRTLHFNREIHEKQYEPVHASLSSLRFPRLNKLVLSHTDATEYTSLIQYLRPQLRSLSIIDADLPDATFFRTIALRCPHLKELRLIRPRQPIPEDSLLPLLSALHSLTSLTFTGNRSLEDDFEHPYTSCRRLSCPTRVFHHLATNAPNLASLNIDSIPEKWCFLSALTSQQQHYFPALQNLTTRATETAFAALSPHLSTLRNLTLYYQKQTQYPASPLRLLAYCPHLRALKLGLLSPFHSSTTSTLPAADLMDLADSCPALETLDIRGANNADAYLLIDGLEDAIVAYCATRWHGLRNLALHTSRAMLGNRSLEELARNCPRLETCDLAAEIAFPLSSTVGCAITTSSSCASSLCPSLPMMENLRSLDLGSSNFHSSLGSSVPAIVDSLTSLAPRLDHFHLYAADPYKPQCLSKINKNVNTAWQSLQMERERQRQRKREMSIEDNESLEVRDIDVM
ncbi:MAG: hypothetical protein M1819_001573 [Sarea resinae]|nr:MAG: hypothetical protein M1819_001573 [Sarea resinae]